MANKRSAARQAMLDMQEMGINISVFIGRIRVYDALNARIGIDKHCVKQESKVEVEISDNIKIETTHTRYLDPIPLRKQYTITRMINPDGTIALDINDRDWDRD